jgi:hypothetical protein
VLFPQMQPFFGRGRRRGVQHPTFAGFAWTPGDVIKVLPQAFALGFIASVNILITSRAVEHFRGRHKRMKATDADAELGAYGVANVFAGIFEAPMSAGFQRVVSPWSVAEEARELRTSLTLRSWSPCLCSEPI